MPNAQDFIKGVGFTGVSKASQVMFDNLVDQAIVADDRGMVLLSGDIAGNPVVPNPDADASFNKWKRYIWARQTAGVVIGYFWNLNAGSDVTYLKWQAFNLVAIADNTIDGSLKLIDASVPSTKLKGVPWAKLTDIPAILSSFASNGTATDPTGVAVTDFQGSYPYAVTIKANAVDRNKLKSAALDANDADRAVGNDHVQKQSIVVDGLSGKLKVAAGMVVGQAKKMLRIADDGLSFKTFRDYFADLSDIGGGATGQTARVKTDGNAPVMEWIDTPVIQSVFKTIAASTTAGTAIPFDNTIPQVGEGDQIASQLFTPKLTTSLIRIRVSVVVSCATLGQVTLALFDTLNGTAADAINVGISTIDTGAYTRVITIEHILQNAAVTARTFQVRVGNAAGNAILVGKSSGASLGGIGKGYMTIEEINGTLS